MVATRRAAQPVVEDELAMDDPELALKKKPVRKAAAAKATKAAPKPAEKPKTTRGKKANPEPETHEDEAEDVPPVKATRKTAGRPKKEAVPEPPAEDVTMSKKPTRAAKVGSLRGKKAVVAVEDVEPALVAEETKPTRASKAGSVRGKKAAVAVDPEPAPAAPEPKSTKNTKAGSVRGRKAAAPVVEAPVLPPPEEPKPNRSTRTTAAKAPPLSPKKITQVSKPATRTTRNTNQKPAAKVAPAKAAPKGRGAARKRTESNENVDPDDDDEEEVEQVSTTLVKPKATRGRAKKAEPIVESEASISSRPTTPNDSATASFNQNDDDIDELQQNDEVESGTPEAMDATSEISDDELCGPKTPMKRSTPGAVARYHESVQRTIRKYEANMDMETPARRFAVLGSQRGTPQTQKPYCKPAPPNSDLRPMTVSRGADRAFVFKDLRIGAPSIGQFEDLQEDQDELSFIPDDDIIPMDIEDSAEQTPTPADGLHSDVDIESDIDTEDNLDLAVNTVLEEDEEAFIAPSLVEPDPEETVLIHDIDEIVCSPVTKPVESFETEDTVLIHRSFTENRNAEMDKDDTSDTDSGSVIHFETTTMESFGQLGNPIAVNFDEHMTNARSSPQKLHSEDLASTVESVEHAEDATVRGAMEVDFDDVIQQPQSRRQTVNLNEYIDISALSEPTIALDDLPNEVNTVQTTDMELDVQTLATETPLLDEEQSTADADNAEQAVAGAEELLPQVELNFAPAEPAEASAIEPAATMAQEAHRIHEAGVPHYALPTIVFDARRKSLPVLSFQTPVNVGARPNTSDGASMPRIANPFTKVWLSKQSRPATAATPAKSRPNTAHGMISQSNVGSPANASKVAMPAATPGDRFPRFAPRSNYEEHAKTAAPPVRFQTPTKVSPKRRETFHKAMPGQINSRAVAAPSSPVQTPIATPQVTPGERYPRLRPRHGYEEHAKTVAAPVRFKTPPAKTPLKRPATTQKSDSLRIAALRATGSHTPIKTPLKAPAMTPGQVPMTPHPAAPLSGVVAMVEVYTLEGASASTPFVALLHRLGAKTARSMSDKVTHVIFKDGSPTTLQRVRLNNKEVEATGKGAYICCVNSRWVTDCDAEGVRKDEGEEEYAVDVAEVPRGGKRRRKSMEPSALMNIGGNIVRERKTSLGRASIGRSSSFGRSPLKTDSPAKQPQSEVIETPTIDAAEKENSGDDQSSPATPAWIAAPSQLVQQTAPMNRIRKLELQGGKSPKNRRLTFWSGGA